MNHVLWTGGLDSTYRVVECLLHQKTPVQPYYFIDVDRPSLRRELATIHAIRRLLFREHPFTRDLLRGLRFVDVQDIRPNAEVEEAYRELKRRRHIGAQYEWLARYCANKGLRGIELGIISKRRSVGRGRPLADSLSPYLVPLENESDVYVFDRSRTGPTDDRLGPLYGVLFGMYRYPIIKLTKSDMIRRARQRGWGKLMDATWYCHKPRRGSRPCGRCTPCRTALDEGAARGMALPRRLRHRLYRLIR